jgi:hypothetical protein
MFREEGYYAGTVTTGEPCCGVRISASGQANLLPVPQYSETNVMHFLLSLLRIKGLYMFRALLAHPQDSLHK